MLQVDSPAPRLPPVRVIVVAVEETVPPHCGVAGATETVTFAGRLSVKFKPLCAAAPPGLVIVNVSVDVLPAEMLVGLKALVNTAGGVTVREALTLLESRLADVALMLAATLLWTPKILLVTVATILQVANPAPRLPPVRVIVVAVDETTPAHWGVAGATATVTFAGRLSVKFKPLCAGFPPGLLRVNVKVLVLPDGMLVGLNALFKPTALITVNVAFTPV